MTSSPKALRIAEALEILKKEGVGPSQIADKLEISPQAVYKWPKTGNISNEALAWLSVESGLDLMYLAKGVQSSPNSSIPHRGQVPLVKWSQAVKTDDFEELISPDGIYLYCPTKHGSRTYAVEVMGDAMTSSAGRSYPEGSIIFVDPDQADTIAAQDRLIARLSNGQSTFRELGYDGDQRYLKALNPIYGHIFDDFKIIGKVIGMWVEE